MKRGSESSSSEEEKHKRNRSPRRPTRQRKQEVEEKIYHCDKCKNLDNLQLNEHYKGILNDIRNSISQSEELKKRIRK